MSRADERRPARSLAISLVALVVVGVGIASAVVPVPAEPAPPAARPASALAAGTARSSSSFCAAATGTSAAATVYLTNTTTEPVRGLMTATGNAAATPTPAVQRRSLLLPPLTTSAVDPNAGLPAGDTGSSYSFSGGGVAVTEAVSGSIGWSMAPCASTVAQQWFFPVGSTGGGDHLELSLFNPTAAPAMANVSFLTPGGVLAPPPFQGIDVAAGQLVDEDVGSYAPGEAELATVVTAVAGSLVSEELQRFEPGPPSGLSLELGSASPSAEWRFPGTRTDPGATVTFSVADPSPTPAAVTFSAGLTSASVVPRTVEVAPSSTATFTPSSTPGWPRGTPFAVTVRATAPVVVGRAVTAAAAAPAPGRGATPGVATTSRRWVLPAPGTPAAPATSGGATVRAASVADAGSSAVRVTLASLADPGRSLTVLVGPGQAAVLTTGQLPGAPPYAVTAAAPVAVEVDGAPSGASGVVAWPGMPEATP